MSASLEARYCRSRRPARLRRAAPPRARAVLPPPRRHHSSPVRELLKIASGRRSSRSPAACPRRRRSTSPGCARRSTRCWPGRTRSARCSTRPPRATRRCATRLAGVHVARGGLRGDGRRPADHHGLPAGARAGRRRAAATRATRAGRGPDLPRGAAGVPAGRRRAASPIPATPTGPDPDGAARAARARPGAKVAYLIPTFQNPTGRTLPRRAPRARSPRPPPTAGLWLVEDDPYSALRLDGEPVDLLAAQPAARERTIVIQTLSKVLSPGLRIGYLRAPAALCAARSPWPSRPPTCTPRRSPSSPPSAGWPRTTWASTSRGAGRPLPPAPRRAAGRPGARTCPRAARARARRAACSSGSTLPAGPRRRGDPPARDRARRGVRPGPLLLRGRAGPARPCACPSPRPRRRSCARAPRVSGPPSAGRRPRCRNDHAPTSTRCARPCATTTSATRTPEPPPEERDDEGDDDDED